MGVQSRRYAVLQPLHSGSPESDVMSTPQSIHAAEQAHYQQVLLEILKASPELDSAVNGMQKMTFTDFKAASKFSEQYGKLATPKGATALFHHFSKVKSSAAGGAIARRAKYYTRGVDALLTQSQDLDQADRLAGKLDYLEAHGRFKAAKSDDVQFIVTNMGETKEERRITADSIEGAERSVKMGGMRRRNVNSATIMGGLIIALPAELTNRQRQAIAAEICKFFDAAGVFYLAVGHKPSSKGDQRNHHLHLLFSQRPFHGSENGDVVFSEKVNRELQGPRFLKKLRQITTSACNRALETAGHPRRIFAGTYAENGLPFGESRHRLSLKNFQHMRVQPSENSIQNQDQPALIALMRDIVTAVEKRVQHDKSVAVAEQKAQAASDKRLRLVDATMRKLLAAGTMFVVDKNSIKLRLALHQDGRVRSVTPAQLEPGTQLVIPGEPPGVRRLLTKMGSQLQDWVAQNSPLLMKSWAAKPRLAQSAIQRFGGRLSVVQSGAVSVKPIDGTWTGKGILSWLSDAVRNYGAREMTMHLTGVDASKTDLRPIPAASKQSSDLEAYIIALHSSQAVDARSLAALRRQQVASLRLGMTMDQIPAIDSSVEQSLYDYVSAAYLVQQHRKLIAGPMAHSAEAQGLAREEARYQAALIHLETVALPVREVRDAVRGAVVSAAAYFGPTLWQKHLGSDLVKVFGRLNKLSTDVVVDHLSTMHLELNAGKVVKRGELKEWANALKASHKTSSYPAYTDEGLEGRQP